MYSLIFFLFFKTNIVFKNCTNQDSPKKFIFFIMEKIMIIKMKSKRKWNELNNLKIHKFCIILILLDIFICLLV